MSIWTTLLKILQKFLFLAPLVVVGGLILTLGMTLSLTALGFTSFASLLSAVVLPYYFESATISASLIFGSIFAAILSFLSFLFFLAYLPIYFSTLIKALLQRL